MHASLHDWLVSCACAYSALAQLWGRLVGAGLLSDAEFWASRQSLLAEPEGAATQRQGFTSAMISSMSIQPSADGKSQQVAIPVQPGALSLPPCR